MELILEIAVASHQILVQVAHPAAVRPVPNQNLKQKNQHQTQPNQVMVKMKIGVGMISNMINVPKGQLFVLSFKPLTFIAIFK